MTNEERDRWIQQRDEWLRQHDDWLRRHEQAVERHDEAIQTVTNLVGRLAQAETVLVERLDTLAAAGRETEERLNALIVTVEKFISRRNDGQN